jgi:aminomethyltransferase
VGVAERRASPLLDEHRRFGAKLTEFGGWEMPLQYTGIIAEHNAVRTGAGVFDVSHLGKLRIADDGGALQRAVTQDVMGLEPGRATYALVLDDDAGCIDDVFVYRIGANEWLVVPNAGNVAAVAEALRVSGADPVDEWDRWAILAVQGPASLDLFDDVFDTATTAMRLHSWTGVDVFGAPGFVARTGYTGERGIELYAPAAEAPAAFRALLDAGAVPVGLGARDTLRLEMGYALYGHEIDRETNPLEAGLGWAVSWDAPFRGREALVEVKERGPRKRLFGIRCIERGVPRPGYRVLVSGEDAGEVVSGNYSPTLGTGIALAYAPAERVPREGERVSIEGRGRRVQGDIVKPPFVRKK